MPGHEDFVMRCWAFAASDAVARNKAKGRKPEAARNALFAASWRALTLTPPARCRSSCVCKRCNSGCKEIQLKKAENHEGFMYVWLTDVSPQVVFVLIWSTRDRFLCGHRSLQKRNPELLQPSS